MKSELFVRAIKTAVRMRGAPDKHILITTTYIKSVNFKEKLTTTINMEFKTQFCPVAVDAKVLLDALKGVPKGVELRFATYSGGTFMIEWWDWDRGEVKGIVLSTLPATAFSWWV